MKITLSILLTIFTLTGTSHALTQDLPDPTRPADYQTTVIVRDLNVTRSDWRLTAIRISDTDRTAILNDRIVRVGDSVGQATIVDIQSVQVILRSENRQIAVRLFSDGVIRKQARKGED